MFRDYLVIVRAAIHGGVFGELVVRPRILPHDATKVHCVYTLVLHHACDGFQGIVRRVSL